MKTIVVKGLLPLGVALGFIGAARADFNPVQLTPGSFNADVVVERTAPPPVNNFVTATMDGGTNNNAWTWYEMGYNAGQPWSGLPTHNSTFTAANAADHQFQMPPDYTVNNAVCVYTAIPTGTLTLTTPAALNALSVLNAGGGGNSTINYTIHHQGGGTETGTLSVNDWFTGAAAAWTANGRFTMDNATFGNLSGPGGYPRLFYNDIPLSDTVNPVTSIDFSSTSGNRAAIFALSGQAVGGGNYSPLAVTGFNRDMIVEASAPAPSAVFSATTVTIDSGTNNYDNTYYEQGYAGRTTTGVPAAGSTFTNAAGNRAFTMPSTYVGNDCLFIGPYPATDTHPDYTVGTLNLTAPAAYNALSILNSSGNGPVPINVTVHHSGGGTESFSISAKDWFDGSTAAWVANGRFSVQNLAFNNVNGGACKLFSSDITLTDQANPVTSIDFAYAGTGGGRTAIFALAGQTASSGVFYGPVGVTGFNADVVVEASAPVRPGGLYSATSVSMDGGTNNTGATWYEQGYYAQFPYSGLPAAGSTITSLAQSDHHYQMPASYTANNAIYVDSAHTNANLTPITSQAASALSFLSATANGNVTNQCIIQYQDGTSETNQFVSNDWFNNNPYAFSSLGRVNLDSHTINNDPGHSTTPNPRLYEAQFFLGNFASPVTNVALQFLGAANPTSGRMVVLAVSAATGPVAPILRNQPANVTALEGSNVTFTVNAVSGTPPITEQWQYSTDGGTTWNNLVDGGFISGSTTVTLHINNVVFANAGQYRMIASNVVGPVTSAAATLTVFSGLPDVTKPGDAIAAFGGNTPAAEGVANAINDVVTNKYLNFGANNGNTPFAGPVGLIVTPAMGSSIVKALRIYTANDATERDPADYVLEGSNDGGTTWAAVSSGSLALPTARNTAGNTPNPLTMAMQEIEFYGNANGYYTYRLTINNVRDNANASSMQLGEIELLGVTNPVPPAITRQPLPAENVYVGGFPTFGVSAMGTPPLSYQWYLNGTTPISGATSASYTLAGAQLADSGKSFSCRVTNPYGTATSSSSLLTVTARPTDPYPAAVLNDNPVALWRLDEPDNGSGNNGVPAVDRVGGHNGYYSNVVLAVSGFNPTADPDTAALFGQFAGANGVQDNVVEGIQDLSFATPTNNGSAFSVEAWVLGNAQLVDAGLITKGTGGGGEQFNLDCGGNDPTHTFRFFVRDASGNTHGATAAKGPDGSWHHVVGVCDELHSNVVLYVDGIRSGAAGTVNPWDGILASSTPVSLGSRQSNASTNFDLQFNGTVDEVAVYNYALSSNQVLNHYFAAAPAPVFTLQPTNTTAGEGSTATFYSSAYGPAPLSYQWYRSTDGGGTWSVLSGKTTANLSIPNVPASANGYMYEVTAANPNGTVTSAAVTLTVVSGPPQILADIPPAGLVYAGRTALFNVELGGTAPFTCQWTRNGVNLSDDARITGSHSNVLAIANAQVGDTASYQLHVSNAYGSADSTSEALTVQARPAFNTDGTGWTLNGTPSPATIVNNVLQLTYNAGSTARSAFYNTPLYIGNFYAGFTYQDVGGGGADGVAFVVQNDTRGAAALGGGGGGLGVSGITPAAELTFNIYSGSPGGPGISFGVNGANGAPYHSTAPVDVASGDPINVAIRYDGTTAQVTLTDSYTIPASVFTTNLPIGSLAAMFGTDTAYVGLTGADGGIASTQNISNFVYIPYPALTAQSTGSGTVVLSWPAEIGGYVLQSRAALGSGTWQNVGATVSQVNGRNQVTLTGVTGAQFYRLTLP